MTLRSLFYWLYVASIAGGALYFWALSRRPKGVPQYEYLVAISIPVWSGLAYLAMAMGQGQVEVAGQIAYYARYLDWIVSTPLLLLALSFTAMQFIEKDWMLISSLVGTQTIVIVTGLIADLSARGLGENRLVFMWNCCICNCASDAMEAAATEKQTAIKSAL